MLIGTDVSIQVCKDEGYLIMDQPKRKYNHNVDVTFIQYLPEYCRVNEPVITGKRVTSWNTIDLWDSYQRDKKSIQSFADYHIEDINDIKTYFDMLILADNINSYKGIFD